MKRIPSREKEEEERRLRERERERSGATKGGKEALAMNAALRYGGQGLGAFGAELLSGARASVLAHVKVKANAVSSSSSSSSTMLAGAWLKSATMLDAWKKALSFEGQDPSEAQSESLYEQEEEEEGLLSWLLMGRGDPRTKRGKRWRGSNGKTRPTPKKHRKKKEREVPSIPPPLPDEFLTSF